jgi:hypothetical protein
MGQSRNLKFGLLVGAAAFFLLGCAPNYIRVYSKIDPQDKVVFVPVRYVGAKAEVIRDFLGAQGWSIHDISKEQVVAQNKARGNGNFEDFEHLRAQDDSPAGYTLLIRHRDNSLLTLFTFDVSSVISFIDNKSGGKVFMVAGRGDRLIEEFMSALIDASGGNATK